MVGAVASAVGVHTLLNGAGVPSDSKQPEREAEGRVEQMEAMLLGNGDAEREEAVAEEEEGEAHGGEGSESDDEESATAPVDGFTMLSYVLLRVRLPPVQRHHPTSAPLRV